MLQQLLQQFRMFSRENWWVYILLLLCLGLIFFTDTGNVVEIFLIFIVYVIAEICMMNMIVLREKKSYKIAALFQLIGISVFNILFMYHFLETGQIQYLIGSVGFVIATFKNIGKYYFSQEMSWVHGTSLFFINIFVFIIAYSLLGGVTWQIFFQALGWIFFSSSLVAGDIYIKIRYFSGLFGLISMVVGTFIGLVLEFQSGNIYGVTLCYFLFPLSVLLVYLKTLRNYL